MKQDFFTSIICDKVEFGCLIQSCMSFYLVIHKIEPSCAFIDKARDGYSCHFVFIDENKTLNINAEKRIPGRS